MMGDFIRDICWDIQKLRLYISLMRSAGDFIGHIFMPFQITVMPRLE